MYKCFRFLLCIGIYLVWSSSLIAQGNVKFTHLDGKVWVFRKSGDTAWLPAAIPGTVHTDLLALGLIPDPFVETNESKVQWIENEAWEYRTSFNVQLSELRNHHVELIFEGLDTYADVYLNDCLILKADNMFRTWEIDVKKYLNIGSNSLRIQFHSAVNHGKSEASKLRYTLPSDERIFCRKAQYQFGWDWGPRLVTCGIWKTV